MVQAEACSGVRAKDVVFLVVEGNHLLQERSFSSTGKHCGKENNDQKNSFASHARGHPRRIACFGSGRQDRGHVGFQSGMEPTLLQQGDAG